MENPQEYLALTQKVLVLLLIYTSKTFDLSGGFLPI